MNRAGKEQWRDILGGNVLAFGLVSFFNDLSSEMIYPLLPIFFSGFMPSAMVAVYIGLMEGISESTASLLKLYSGRLSDRLRRRKPLALAGYAVSNIIRPLTALAAAGWQVAALRLGDRIGKGIRTAPRDALLSESITADIRGRAFSFHRLMDHGGAVGGPLLAAAFLYLVLGRTLLWQQGIVQAGSREMNALRWLFALAALPGIAATIFLWRLVKEKTSSIPIPQTSAGPTTSSGRLPPRFFFFLLAVVIFTLGNSSDLFIIFYAQTRFGLGLGWIISLWILLHIAKIFCSMPGGWLADRLGRRAAIMSGWLVYLIVYTAIPMTAHLEALCGLLLLYGLYYGLTEGAERALVADFTPPQSRGRAYGWYHGVIGFAALPASLLFGVFWARLGARNAFFIGAALAASALCLLLLTPTKNLVRRH